MYLGVFDVFDSYEIGNSKFYFGINAFDNVKLGDYSQTYLRNKFG